MRAEEFLPDGQDRIEASDGRVVRKGTIGAFLANASIWSDASTQTAQRAQVERDILDALPTLRSLGMFDVCVVRDAALQSLINSN
jgi:hypothetical protein